MQSLSLLSWLARMWRWTQTWPSSSPWTLAMPGGQTYQTTSNNSLGGKPIICMYTHACCMHVPCACNVIGMMIVCVMMMEIWYCVMSLIASHNSLTGSNNCCMMCLLINNFLQSCHDEARPSAYCSGDVVLPGIQNCIDFGFKDCTILQVSVNTHLYARYYMHMHVISSLHVPTYILLPLHASLLWCSVQYWST